MFGDMETATKSKFKVGDKVRYQNTRERHWQRIYSKLDRRDVFHR